jgi:hypothetical protein
VKEMVAAVPCARSNSMVPHGEPHAHADPTAWKAQTEKRNKDVRHRMSKTPADIADAARRGKGCCCTTTVQNAAVSLIHLNAVVSYYTKALIATNMH